MSRFLEIQHDEWIGAGPDVVRAHYTDLHHRQVARVHPRERVRPLPPGPGGARYERLLKHGWHLQRDVYERQLRPDGSVVDTCVAGSHGGRTISARFWRRDEGRQPGTLVELTVTEPLRPLLGSLVSRWLRRRLEGELREFAGEEKVDVERGYAPGRLRAA
ncbi:MAG TPA: hypothetical protein VF457_16040 [Burkholderiaceae bacterium]